MLGRTDEAVVDFVAAGFDGSVNEDPMLGKVLEGMVGAGSFVSVIRPVAESRYTRIGEAPIEAGAADPPLGAGAFRSCS